MAWLRRVSARSPLTQRFAPNTSRMTNLCARLKLETHFA